jgi:hypothetical protein
MRRMISPVGGFMARAMLPTILMMGCATYWMPNSSSNVALSLLDQVFPRRERTQALQAFQESMEYYLVKKPVEWKTEQINGLAEQLRNIENSLFGSKK